MNLLKKPITLCLSKSRRFEEERLIGKDGERREKEAKEKVRGDSQSNYLRI